MSSRHFEDGQVAALATHIEHGEDGPVFHGPAGMILCLFGLPRLEFKMSGDLLTVRVFEKAKKRR